MPNYLSNDVLDRLLAAAAVEERLALTQVIDKSAIAPMEPGKLRQRLTLAAGHRLMNTLRGQGISYAEILTDACELMKVEGRRSYFSSQPLGFSVSQADRSTATLPPGVTDSQCHDTVLGYVKDQQKMLLSKLMVDMYEGMTPQQRGKVDAELEKLAKENGLGGVGKGAALLALGNLGGFATYTFMSTVLGAVSFGTLSFGAYTFASSALSVLLGPVGWIALGAYAANKVGSPEKAQVVRMAATCALVYERLVADPTRRML